MELYQNLTHFFHAFCRVWNGHQHQLGCLFFLATLVLLALSFYLLIISPLIFNYYIIPRIERKVGQKLGYRWFDDLITFGKWLNRQNWVAIYIVNRYLVFKFRHDKGVPTSRYFKTFPLRQVGYTIDLASKTEIFFSFVFMIVMIVSFIMLVGLGVPAILFKSYILTH